MNRWNRGFAVVFGILVAAACGDGLTEVNENPNAPEVVPVENILLKGIWDVVANRPGRGAFGDWTQIRHGENWAQHLGQPIYNDEDKYIPRAGVNELVWSEMYFALTDLLEAKKLADADDDPTPGTNPDNIWAIAEIMTIYGFMVLTDYYGDIPYTEALSLLEEEAIPFPKYDLQSAIYPDMIARLVAAAGRIDTAALVDFGDFDPVYQGDMDGWLAFANSLQLRLAMRMSNAAAGTAGPLFSTAWGSTRFTGVAEHADVEWPGVAPAANPVYEAIVFDGRQGDWRMSESLVDRMAAFNDPRLPIYAEPAVSDGQFRGIRNGRLPGQYTNPKRGASDFSTIGSYFLDPLTPTVLLSYAETLFLGAEAAALGWITASAATLYADGITASMEEFGIDAADITTYLAQPAVSYATGTYTGLDAIHVQKWMALFLAGPEAFVEMRRVGWMDLIPADNSVLPAGMFPARLPYPSDEPLVNPNFPGVEPITSKVWWAN